MSNTGWYEPVPSVLGSCERTHEALISDYNKIQTLAPSLTNLGPCNVIMDVNLRKSLDCGRTTQTQLLEDL